MAKAKDKTYLIFLVDDDQKHLLLLKEHLVKHLPYNLKVENILDGQECLNRLNENPDLIILDYYFDGVSENAPNGVEILKKIKHSKPGIPVVMMSHQDKLEVAVTCYDYGVKDYIIKNETAFARAQLVVRNVIHELIKEEVSKVYKEGVKYATMIIGAFIVILIGVIIYLISEH
jgi:DNA-binding NtrC family response regulator